MLCRFGPAGPERALRMGQHGGDGLVASIFDRNGGFASIRKVVSSFYDEVLASPNLSHHFAHIDMRSLISHQTQFMSYVMGGPGASYTDDALQRVHAPLHITRAELEEMRRLLRETLEDHGFSPADIAAIDRELDARTDVIVNDRSGGGGPVMGSQGPQPASETGRSGGGGPVMGSQGPQPASEEGS
jgi:hemoglobin